MQQRGTPSRSAVVVAFGPEGGWIPSELDSLQNDLGFSPFRMTDAILKCESALDFCLGQLSVVQDPRLGRELHSASNRVLSERLKEDALAAEADVSFPYWRYVMRDQDGFMFSCPPHSQWKPEEDQQQV